MIAPSYYPIKGGAESVIHDLSVMLNNKGIRTDIVTFNMEQKWKPYWFGRIETNGGIIVYKIPAFNWCPIEHSDKITFGINLIPGNFRKILKKYDVLHFHGGDFSFPFFSYGIKKPKLFQLHGFSSELYRRYFINRLILRNIADMYLCLTKCMKEELIEIGIPEEKIKILPNGIDTDSFYPLGKKEENLILFIGRICPEKGVHILLKSLDFLKTSVKLAIIGPSDWSKEYFDYIMKLIRKENMRNKHKVIYLGAKSRSELIEWYRRATFLVLPSYREGFPVVILEALACETPVVATNVGGIQEFLQDKEYGFLVPPNNPRRLAEAMQFLLDYKDVRIKFGSRGRIAVKERFSLNAVSDTLIKIYEEALLKFGA